MKSVLGIISVAISVGIILWLLSRIDTFGLILTFKEFPVQDISLFIILIGFTPLVGTLRWLSILKTQPEVDIKFSTALKANMIANVLNSFLPSKSGDLAKGWYLKKQNLSIGIGTVILERIIDLSNLSLIAFIAGLYSGQKISSIVGFSLMILLVSMVGILGWFPFEKIMLSKVSKLTEIFLSFRQVIQNWIQHPYNMVMTTVFSLLVWLLNSLAVANLIGSINPQVPLARALAIYPLAILSGLVPLTISGLGTRDATFVFLLEPYMSSEAATMISLSYTATAYWLLSCISLPFVLSEIRRYFNKL